jgi:hypothetical protein
MEITPIEETTDETPTIAAPGDAPSLRS